MGGAASTEKGPKRPLSVTNNAILKTTKVRRTRAQRGLAAKSSAFTICDRISTPICDPDITNQRVFAVLLGQNHPGKGVSEHHDDEENVLQVAIDQAEECNNMASECQGQDGIVLKISAFLTDVNSNNDRTANVIATLLLTGPSGSGVSFIVSKALSRSAGQLDDANCTLIYRQIKANTITALQLVSSISSQLNIAVPTCLEEVRKSLDAILRYGTNESPLILVLDGLNHLIEDPTDVNLEWLVPSLVSTSNLHTRCLFASSPFPKSPVELALCRSLVSCSILSVPPLTEDETKSLISAELEKANCLPAFTEDLQSKVTDVFALVHQNSMLDGLSPLYVKCVSAGILIPHLTNVHGHESLPDPLPGSCHEAFEQFLVTLETTYLQLEQSSQKVNPPVLIRPTRLEMEARKHLIIQILSLVTLANAAGGMTADTIQQILPPPPNPPTQLNGKVALTPTVVQILEHLVVAVPGTTCHLTKDKQNRWIWRHGLAKQVAEYRYLNIRKPADQFGAVDADDATKLLASVFVDSLSTQRRSGSMKNLTTLGNDMVLARDILRLICIAQKKNELLSQLLDIKTLITMSKAWGGVSGTVNKLMAYRRHALVERGIFLSRERVEDLDAIIMIMERHRKLLEIGIRESCLDIVFKQMLCISSGDWGTVELVIDGFQTRLKKKEEGFSQSRSRSVITRQKSGSSSRTSVIADKIWLFKSERDLRLDCIAQEPIILVQPTSSSFNHVSNLVASADGRFLTALVGLIQIRTFEASPFRELWTTIFEESVTAIVMSPTGKTMAIATGRKIHVYKTISGNLTASICSIDSDVTAEETIEVNHMQFSNETTLIISTQFGHLYCWSLSHVWGSAQEFKASDIVALKRSTESAKFIISPDEFTCAWWTPTFPTYTTEAVSISIPMAQLSIFNLSLETPSNALSHRVKLELPAITAAVRFMSKGNTIAAIESDSIYCVDAKTGDLSWSQTTLNAGISGDWVDVCLFTDLEGNEAVIAVSKDGWAVDVTNGNIRWRMDLGLKDGDTIARAEAMNGHLPNQKYAHARNQYAIGQHILYATKRGGLYAVALHNWPRTSVDSELTPAIGKVICVSCDPNSDQTVAVDSSNVIHMPSTQQIKISSDADSIIFTSIISRAIVIITQESVFSFPIGESDSCDIDGEQPRTGTSCALLNPPKTFIHASKALMCCTLSENTFAVCSNSSLTIISIDPDASPVAKSSVTLDSSLGTFAVLCAFMQGDSWHIACVTKSGAISIHDTENSANSTAVICEDIFTESGFEVGLPGFPSPEVLSASVSHDGKHLAVGDSLGGIRIISLAGTLNGAIRVEGAYYGPVVGLKWINGDEFVSLGADGMILVWRLNNDSAKIAVKGVLDVGNFGTTCLDLVEMRDDDDNAGKYRICVGGNDGRAHEYFMDSINFAK
ncbi:hypothetical protein BC830DRAFT_1172521 [Chytriomyces sp. MP71]|nr:hypothetical protein BC830DRAFT_1172521 [Chytriomyces sp. MP71]